MGEIFLGKLACVTDPETKRKIIGNEFIRVFEEKNKN
jgi:GMP synthase (glutamine-hydrolysing)